MQCAVHYQYGGPEVIRFETRERPQPQPQELLLKVKATSVTATDSIFRGGKDRMARCFTGLRRPGRSVLGSEFVAEVVAVGERVTRFGPGDTVLGPTPEGFGAHAEYFCLPEESVLVAQPGHLSDVEAAGLCSGALTAWPFLNEVAALQAGQNILIIGASGSVGSFAVQIAVALGAQVTVLSREDNHPWLKALGVEKAWDYTQLDYTTVSERFDVVFDAVGKSTFHQAKRVLAPGGKYLTTRISLRILWQCFYTRWSSYRACFVATGLRSTAQKQEDLEHILAQYHQRKIQVVVDRVYPFKALVEAHRYVDQGHKKGNVIVEMDVR